MTLIKTTMKNKNKIKDLLNRVEKIEKHISDNTEVGVSKIESTELTELPENWCLELKYENIKLINIWRQQDSRYNDILNAFGYIYYNRIWTFYYDEDCVKITFDQFKKWVLKEDYYFNKCLTKEKCLDFLKKEQQTLSIREVQVKVSSQEEAYECAEIAKSLGEIIWDFKFALNFDDDKRCYFQKNNTDNDFFIGHKRYDLKEISMDEFRNLFGSKKIKPVEFDTLSVKEFRERFGYKSKVVKSDHLKEIDWSKAGQLVKNEKGNVFSIIKEVNLNSFQARTIFYEGKTKLDNTIYVLDKEYFKLCNEPITLSN